jgi:competence protein ComEC
MNPGGFNYGEYLKRKGVEAVASISGQDKIQKLQREDASFMEEVRIRIAQGRERIQRVASQTLQGPALGLFLGMIIGEQGFIPVEVRDAFMATGTVHIISISGSHLGLLAFLSFMMVKLGCRRLPISWFEGLVRRITPTRLAIFLTIPLVVFYTALAGSEVPTVRSLIMILVFFLAQWLGRERDILGALSIAAFLILGYEPQAIFDISFQLSFMAVLALGLVITQKSVSGLGEESEDTRGARVKGWLKDYGRLTFTVTLATLPLVAWYFNHLPWLGLVANMLVVPFVGFIFVPLGLLSAVVVLFSGAESLPFGSVNQLVLDILIELNALLAQIPFAKWSVASPALITIILFYALLLYAGSTKGSTPLRWVCALGVVAILLNWAWSPRWAWDSGTLRVSFLDVGEGDATLIEFPQGQTMLIDAGAAFERWDYGRMVVGPYLWDRGIRRLDHVVATHPQIDHIGGFNWVVQNFDVGKYWSNGVQREKLFFENLKKTLDDRHLEQRIAEKGNVLFQDTFCHVESLNPQIQDFPKGMSGTSSKNGTDLNNQSVVIKLECGPHSFLFPGDIEIEALDRMIPEKEYAHVTMVKIPHHGAKSSFNREWIQQLEAETAVVSAGRHNRYGHPAPVVVQAYEKQGMVVYRTDHDGAVWVEGKMGSSMLAVHTAQNKQFVQVPLSGAMGKSEGQNWSRLWSLFIGAI